MQIRRYFKLLTLVIILSFGLLFSGTALAAGDMVSTKAFYDTGEHWAGDQISEWAGKSLVKGYSDGTFRPDKSITRAEFITLINKAFGFNEEAKINYSDVSAADWFSREIARAKAVGYIAGYPDNSIKPNNEISRQEAAAIIYRILRSEAPKSQNVADRFADSASIRQWSRDAVSSIVTSGYMNGYPDQTFQPIRPTTRAETITILNRAAGTLFNTSGVQGPVQGIHKISGNATVSVPGVTLQNTIIEGDLYLTEGIGEGDVELNNVTVKGRTLISGGGENSITIRDSVLGSTKIDKPGGYVRVLATGSTAVGEITVNSGAKIEENQLSGNGFGNVVLSESLKTTTKPVTLAGNFKTVEIRSNAASIDVARGTLDALNITETAANTTVNLGNEVKVTSLKLDAVVKVAGKGIIENATVNKPGIQIEQTPVKLTLAPDTTVIAGGKEVTESITNTQTMPSTSSDSDSDSDSGSSTVAATGLSLNLTSLSLITGGDMGILTAAVEPSNATNKNVTWTSSNEDVAAVSDGIVTPVAAGTTTITVKTIDGGFTAACDVTVQDTSELTISSLTTTKDEVTITFSENIESIAMPNSITVTSGTYDFDVYSGDGSIRFGHYGLIEQTTNSMTIAVLGDWGDLSSYGNCSFVLYTGGDPLNPTIVDQSDDFTFAARDESGTSIQVISSDPSEIWLTVSAPDGQDVSAPVGGFTQTDFTLFDGSGIQVPFAFAVGSAIDANLPDYEYRLTPASGVFDGMYRVRFSKNGYNPAVSQQINIDTAVQGDIVSVSFSPDSYTAGIEHTIPVTVTTSGINDGTAITLSLVGESVDDVIVAPVPGNVSDNTAVIEITVPSTVPAGLYYFKAKITEDILTYQTVNFVEEASVTGISVKTSPLKAAYNEGENLDLTGLTVTLTKSDASTEDIAIANFGTSGITTNPADATALSTAVTGVVITHTASGASTTQAITVNAVPAANNDSAEVNEDSTVLIDVLANDTDADGDTLSITGFTQGTNGTVTKEGDSLRYKPNVDFREIDSFEYEIDDGNGGTDRATVNIIINITSSLTNVFNNSYSEVSGNFDVPFTIVSEGIYVFETSQYIEPCDTVMYLYDVNDNIIAMNDNYVDSYSTIVKNLGPGDYNLRVEEKSLEQLNANLTIYLKS